MWMFCLDHQIVMPAEGPEVEAERNKRKEFDKEWPAMLAVLSGNTALEPITIEIEDRKEEDLIKELSLSLEREFLHTCMSQSLKSYVSISLSGK